LLKLFADNPALSLSDSYIRKLNYNINIELNKINDWMILSKFSINYAKTKFMIRTNWKRNDECQIKISQHTLKQVKQIYFWQQTDLEAMFTVFVYKTPIDLRHY